MPVVPKFVGALAIAGRVERAIAFSVRSDVYVAYGRNTPWGELDSDEATYGTDIDEDNPPPSDPLAPDLEEPIGFKKATLSLVVPDPDGNIDLYLTKWRQITAEEARTLGSPYVLVEAEVAYDLLPTEDFRQLAIFSGLVRDPDDLTNFPGRVELLPEQVQSHGVLEYIYFHDKAERDDMLVDVFQLIMTL